MELKEKKHKNVKLKEHILVHILAWYVLPLVFYKMPDQGSSWSYLCTKAYNNLHVSSKFKVAARLVPPNNPINARALSLGPRLSPRTLSNYDDEDNDNVKKQLVLWPKKQPCTCITLFSTFLWRPVHDYYVKPPNATFYGGRGHTATDVPFSIWTWIKSLSRLHLTNRAVPNRRDKVWKDANSFFGDVFTT